MICETTDGTALAAGTAGLATFQVPRGVAPAVIVGVALLLYLPGLRWGLPATSSWSQDTIAAIRTLGALEGWPEQWKARYPPFHFLVLGAAYQPVLRHWERTGQLTVNERTGRITLGPPHAPKVGLLILIARAITACMALAAGLGLWAATLRFARDDLGALLAAVCFMIGAAFTYFAHLGNVDVPSMCWFAWSLFFFARAIDSRSWVDCLLLGTCASLAACTKDAVAAAYPGMALILLAGEIQRRRKSSPWSRSIVSSICQYQWLIGLAAFVIPFAVINGWLVDPGVYITRMRQWLTPPTGSTLAGEYRYPDQLGLLWASLRQAAGGVGWPMLAAMIASVAWALKFRRRLAWVVLVPALTYYVIVIARISFVYARFLFPVLVLFCVLTGVAAASFWRRHATPPTVRLVVCCAVLLPSIGYAVAIDAEMLTDSRYDVEA